MSNVNSVVNMLNRVGYSSELLEKPQTTKNPEFLILPGVGTFDEGMRGLIKSGWDSALKDYSEDGGIRILGLCLGMQLLTSGSEEGVISGLNLIPGHFKKFDLSQFESSNLKVPHMGWNDVTYNEKISDYVSGFPDKQRFYFVHSYYYSHENDDFVVGETKHGLNFGSVIAKQNIIGVQFHPEKSNRFGFDFFSNLMGKTNA